MSVSEKGVVAAGHPLTAQAGAEVLRAGGNAVDAAVGAMLMSFVAEPLLTGLGAGGYMMVAGERREPVLLDFFVEAPARAQDGSAAELRCDRRVVRGCRAGLLHRAGLVRGVRHAGGHLRRRGALGNACRSSAWPPPRRAWRARGCELNHGQAYVAEILADLLRSTPECAALWAPHGEVLREGEMLRNPELGDALERLGAEGAEPFYRGDVAAAVCAWLRPRGGSLTREALASYEAIERRPLEVGYRDRTVLTNPPPSAGGTLLAYSLALLDRGPSPPALEDVVRAMEAAQAERTPEFVEGLGEEGFQERFLASRLGATTHISVLDAEGCACSVTCTNGEGSGVVVPGTGIHVNNVMGEEDLNPQGFHRHPPGGGCRA